MGHGVLFAYRKHPATATICAEIPDANNMWGTEGGNRKILRELCKWKEQQ